MKKRPPKPRKAIAPIAYRFVRSFIAVISIPIINAIAENTTSNDRISLVNKKAVFSL
jgi:hypothetical protein